MLIEHSGNIIRQIRLNEELTKVGDDPQPWQFKQFNDVTQLGFELVWPYKDFKPFKDITLDSIKLEMLSKDFFAITFNEIVQVKKGYNIFIIPHHTGFTNKVKNFPIAIPQTIEADWWPGDLNIMFKYSKSICFKKDKCFAQGLVIPRREYTVAELSNKDKSTIKSYKQFIDDAKDEYITRNIKIDDLATQSNLYERLSNLNAEGKLPHQLQTKQSNNLRLQWR